MYIVRKKYIIKITSFFCAFVLVLTGIFLYNRRIERRAELQQINDDRSLAINICAMTGNIRTALQKMNETGDSSLSLDIYANSHSAKTLILYSSEKHNNAAAFFSDLVDYSSTGMDDTQRNLEYLSTITKAEQKLINLCTGKKTSYTLSEIFPSPNDSPKISAKEDIKEYPLLNNRVTADRGDIADYARQILEMPISPKQFTGIPRLPKAICYSHQSSYAEIFPAGKTLNKMALVSPHTTTAVSELNIFDAAKHWLTIYAPLAENCKEIISNKTNGAYYFIFCPENTIDGTTYFLYNEKIKIAVSTADNSLKAFDSSEYLQNHGTKKPVSPQIIEPAFLKIPNKAEIISQRNVITQGGSLLETAFTTDGINVFFSNITPDGGETIFTKDEYFRYLSNS